MSSFTEIREFIAFLLVSWGLGFPLQEGGWGLRVGAGQIERYVIVERSLIATYIIIGF